MFPFNLFTALVLFMKGLAMGAADVVPGVSGGTIAFVTGIYQRLISAIRNIAMPETVKEILRLEFKKMWIRVDASFLLILFTGIFTSLIGLASLIKWLLSTYPEPLWSFFIGLVLASALIICRDFKKLKSVEIGLLILAASIAWWISEMGPTELIGSSVNFFFAGMIAICAMILPGISGSFILLLLGMYGPVISAIEALDFGILVFFLLGNLIGLLSFSHVLTWALKRFEQPTMAILVGFMLGALNKLWPWKYTLETHINRHGQEVPLLQENVLPWTYSELTQQPNELMGCILAFIFGTMILFMLQKLASRSSGG